VEATSNPRQRSHPSPRPRQVARCGKRRKRNKPTELNAGRKALQKRRAAFKAQHVANQSGLPGQLVRVAVGGLAFVAQPALCSTYRVRSLAVFIGFQGDWGRSHISCNPADGRDQSDFGQSSFWGRSCRSGRIVLVLFLGPRCQVFMCEDHIFGGFLRDTAMLAMSSKIVKVSGYKMDFWVYKQRLT